MGPVTPEEWRHQVGVHIETQRGRLSIRQAARRAGISEGLWRQIESGSRPRGRGEYETVNPKPYTRAQVAKAIGWPDDAIDRLLAGEPPSRLMVSRLDDDPEQLHTFRLHAVEEMQRQAVLLEDLRAANRDEVEQLTAEIAGLQDVVLELQRRLEALEQSGRESG